MFTGVTMVEKLILAVVLGVASWHGTSVWFVAGVPSLVVVSVSNSRKLGLTDSALVWLLAGMNTDMNL